MACPQCGCKVHYQYNEADFGPDDECMERCAACGHVFDIEDAADDEDDEPAPCGVAPAPANDGSKWGNAKFGCVEGKTE